MKKLLPICSITIIPCCVPLSGNSPNRRWKPRISCKRRLSGFGCRGISCRTLIIFIAGSLRLLPRQCLTLMRGNLSNRKKMGALQQQESTRSIETPPADTAQVAEITRLVTIVVNQMPLQRQRIYPHEPRRRAETGGHCRQALLVRPDSQKCAGYRTQRNQGSTDRRGASDESSLPSASFFIKSTSIQ
jgi:hypothetical protein